MSKRSSLEKHPIEIRESLARFRKDYPDPAGVAFIMMRFSSAAPYAAISTAIRDSLNPFDIAAVRADEREYHSDLGQNVLTYLHGAGFGIAVFDRIESDQSNPNVAFEVGYMFARRKPVCLLKDKTLPTLPTDLVGRLYRVFDPYDVAATVQTSVSAWLTERGIAEPRRQRTPKEILEPLLHPPTDPSRWTKQELDLFFRNLKRDAYDAGRFNTSYVGMKDPDGAAAAEGRAVFDRVLDAYGVRELFEVWKRSRDA